MLKMPSEDVKEVRRLGNLIFTIDLLNIIQFGSHNNRVLPS